MRRKLFILIGCIILYTPFMLGLMEKSGFTPVDTKLIGDSNLLEEPKFVWKDFAAGKYQADYTAWLHQELKPRAFLTKTYSTIRYNLFNCGRWVIGYNRDLFQIGYINSELVINGAKDLSDPQNRREMEHYVEKLKQAQSLLRQYGKVLYLCIAPSKADFDYNNIPNVYKDMASDTSIKPIDYFSELIAETDIPHIICRDKAADLKYPAFYTTGIHWARPFEQEVSAQIVRELAALTNKKYRNIVLGNVNESNGPYWRDTDLYGLLNVWNKIDGERYYEYQEQREMPEQYDKIGILMQGDSFGEGFVHDVNLLYPGEYVYFINRENYTPDNIDLAFYLDHVDAVLIEATEAELTDYSYGFLDYLIDYLPTYQPKDREGNYIEYLDCSSPVAWDTDSLKGFYGCEGDFSWVNDGCQATLESETLKKTGLQIDIRIPKHIFKLYDDDEITIYVNERIVYRKRFEKKWSGSIVIDADQLYSENDIYRIEIYCSRKFVPYETMHSIDARGLAIQILYIGEVR